MTVITIRKAEREGARLVVGVAGISGSGKTFTALQLAYGLANNDASKVGFLDTENRRGSLYADALKNDRGEVQKFWIGDLYAPFSPQRYIDAILEFQKAGVEVLVIDSVSHEWEGQGGCEDIAHTGNPKMPQWNKAKAEHKRFMNALLQSDMHIVVCIRAREKVRIEGGKVTPLGIQPICEKNFMFEMTASLMMWDEGKSQQVMKCPDQLRAILGRESGYITAGDGAALRAWVDGAQQLDRTLEHARNSLRTITEQGTEALIKAWRALPDATRKAISPEGTCPDEFKRAAQDFDTQRERDSARQTDALNNELLGGEVAQ
ncbi:AAA family ATPase [Sphingopyxis sp.]|uniref:AAA family ATPase n=1 Tax=Sphingopyxis sp. TaxID=1908224 RepID=UPI004036D107